jgi:hypothetical protein
VKVKQEVGLPVLYANLFALDILLREQDIDKAIELAEAI